MSIASLASAGPRKTAARKRDVGVLGEINLRSSLRGTLSTLHIIYRTQDQAGGLPEQMRCDPAGLSPTKGTQAAADAMLQLLRLPRIRHTRPYCGA
jgi:hypothetical protein